MGVPQFTGVQVTSSHVLSARHKIEGVESLYPLSHVTVAEDPKVVAVKLREPFIGLTGFPQLTGKQVATSQVSFARHAIEATDLV